LLRNCFANSITRNGNLHHRPPQRIKRNRAKNSQFSRWQNAKFCQHIKVSLGQCLRDRSLCAAKMEIRIASTSTIEEPHAIESRNYALEYQIAPQRSEYFSRELDVLRHIQFSLECDPKISDSQKRTSQWKTTPFVVAFRVNYLDSTAKQQSVVCVNDLHSALICGGVPKFRTRKKAYSEIYLF
jgi:hypothetical protein